MKENETYFIHTTEGKHVLTAYIFTDFIEALLELSKDETIEFDVVSANKVANTYSIAYMKVKPIKTTKKIK